MSTAVARPGAPADADLIQAVRDGDIDAFGDLFERHVEAARRLGRQLVPVGDVDDLVAEAFERVLDALRHGGGPDVAFRAYLLTTLRRLHVDHVRAARLRTADEPGPFDGGVPFLGTALAGIENRAAAEAFASLPERSRMVLWHTEVEGQRPAEVAPLLGMSPDAVSALACRAPEGLRDAFLARHAHAAATDDCRWTHEHLGAYVRGNASRRDAAMSERHLRQCRPCMALYLELRDVTSDLGGLVAPALLGPAAAGYLGAASAASTAGGLLLGRGREWVGAHSGVVGATAGVVAATVVVAGTTWALLGSGDDPVRTPATGSSVASAPADASGDDPDVLTPVATVEPRSPVASGGDTPDDPTPSARAGTRTGSCPIRPPDADPGCVLTGDSTVRLVAHADGGGTLTFRLEPTTGSRSVTVAVS